MAVMHLKFGYTQPLLIQSIMPLKGLLMDEPIIQIVSVDCTSLSASFLNFLVDFFPFVVDLRQRG